MPNPILYHNPRCSKSRQALAFLQANNIEVCVVEYIKQGLSKGQISDLYAALKANKAVTSALDMVRTKEPEYVQAELTKGASDSAIINAIATYPKLLERPILQSNGLAAIGRPLDNIEAMFHD